MAQQNHESVETVRNSINSDIGIYQFSFLTIHYVLFNVLKPFHSNRILSIKVTPFQLLLEESMLYLTER